MKFKRISILNILLLITYFSCILFPKINSYAYEGQSESKRIQWGNLNTFSDKKTSESYYLVDTGGQLGNDVYISSNYKIMAGFGFYYSLIPFSFVIDSESSFNFLQLKPNTPQTASTILTVTSGAAHGYVVTVQQNHPLERFGEPGVYIQDVVGDNSDITHQQEGIWELNSTYGFGYTLDNIVGTDAAFTTGYKQFADASNSEPPQVIIENEGVTRTSSARLRYKINIGAMQKAGYYTSIIKYNCTGTF